MIGVLDFLEAVREIADENPTYRTGGSGADGTCDCVGLLMGAIRRVQKTSFPLHSSNYFARKRMATLEAIADATLTPGMAVYKARPDKGSLNARYKEGGCFYTGDLLDYYHVGIVTGINPLEITHCTSSDGADGIVRDNTAKCWTHAGRLSDINYEEADKKMAEVKAALVSTQDGKPLKMRSTPDTTKPYIAKIPNGSAVKVHADAEGWAKVTWNGKTGYCMSKFLAEVGLANGGPDSVQVEIKLKKETALALMAALQSAIG